MKVIHWKHFNEAIQSKIFAFKYLFKFEEVMPPSSVLLGLTNEKRQK